MGYHKINYSDVVIRKSIYAVLIFFVCLKLYTEQVFAGSGGGSITKVQDDGSQIIYTPSGDSIYNMKLSSDGRLTIIGRHRASNARISYQTVGFVFMAAPTAGNVSESIRQGENHYVIRFDQNTKNYVNGTQEGDFMITTYTFPSDIMEQVIRALDLVIEEESEGSTIYISNIFRVIEYQNGREQEFVYRDENAYLDCSLMLACEQWSPKTLQMLPHYYDMRLQLSKPVSKPEEPIIPTITSSPVQNISEVESNMFVSAVIGAGLPGQERYDVSTAVPAGERLYVSTDFAKYIIDCEFEHIEGTISCPVYVSKDYVYIWEEEVTKYPAPGEPWKDNVEVVTERRTETVSVSDTIYVDRSYSYWKLNHVKCLQASEITVENEVLPENSVTLSLVDRDPAIIVSQLSSNADHIKNTEFYYYAGREEILGKPELLNEDFRFDAESAVGEVMVRNDALSVDGLLILDGSWTSDTAAPDYQQIERLNTETATAIKTDIPSPVTIKNGCHGSEGRIIYRGIGSYELQKAEEKVFRIANINSVNIHTPVVCIPVVHCNNRNFVQLYSPDPACVPIVLDEETGLSDFVLSVSNSGQHIDAKGYGYRNYRLNEYGDSYIAQLDNVFLNEVCFPFDCYIDIGNNLDTKDDYCLKAWEWYRLSTGEQRIYLRSWLEGKYTAHFRTVAANADASDLQSTQFGANTSLSAYVATNIMQFEVSGRLHSLRVTNITGTDWKKPFERGFMLYSGIANSYGQVVREEDITLPAVAGSHPEFKNLGALSFGSETTYEVETVGTLASTGTVSVINTYFYVDKEGKNRTPVEVAQITQKGLVPLVETSKLKSAELEMKKDIPVKVWSGTFSMPSIVTITSESNTALTNPGYLVVNFDIRLSHREDEVIMTYINKENREQGYCNMWKTEQSPHIKKDSYNTVFSINEGDVLIFSLQTMGKSDYISELIY